MMKRLLTSAQMRGLEQAVFASGLLTGLEAMERAAQSVVAAIRASDPQPRAAAVLCGPGNNGGDGFAIARLLREAGFAARVFTWDESRPMSGDAAAMRDRWTGPTGRLSAGDAIGEPLVVDALFGTGLCRPLPLWLNDLRQALAGRRVFAVDIASGIDADSGRPLGGWLAADVTVTFGAMKPGHLLLPGALASGRVVVAPIGLDPADHSALLAGLAGPPVWRTDAPALTPPALDSHKYRRGLALVASGPMISTGAARLAARAALRAGAGLVRLLSPPSALAVNAAHLTAVMLARVEGAGDLAAALARPQAGGLLIGPGFGLGEGACAAVEACLAVPGKTVVLDADALGAFSAAPERLHQALKARNDPDRTLLTPHAGEFTRLFPDLAAVTNKLEQAHRAALLCRASVLLKGPDTVIAAPDRLAINDHASPWLASAGSGDVLAGLILGLMVQRGGEAWASACDGAWLHGEAGRRLGPGLIAEDLPEALPQILGDLLRSGAQTTLV